MLDAAVAALACPVCHGGLSAVEGGLRCSGGHAFDRARQGYVHLAATPIRHPGDTAAMVAARERVQAAGVFDALTRALVQAISVEGAVGVASAQVPVVADLGAGTGHHLARILTALSSPSPPPHALPHTAPHLSDPADIRAGSDIHGGGGGVVGIAIDTSKPALRRAARVHDRVLAIAADVTQRLPLRDGAVDVGLITFAPRAADGLARVVRPGGIVVVATPLPGHLGAIADPLGMLEVPPGKASDVARALGPSFRPLASMAVHDVVTVDRAMAADLALMGPAGFHADEATLKARAGALPEAMEVRIALTVQVVRR